MKITTILLTIALATGVTTVKGQQQMVPAQQEQSTDVSDKELEQFASVYMEVQTESQKMQKNAMEAIEEEGMEVERFNELASAQQNPQQKMEADDKEMEKVNTINTKIEKIQTDFQERVAGMIQKEGLTVQRYQEVYSAIQSDQKLQQKFGEMIKS